MKFSFLVVGLFWTSLTLAAIPKASMILQRTSENAGNGIYQIDQEVQFPNGADTLVLRETWMIENENNMKLVVTGAKELKDRVSFSMQILNGQHSSTRKKVSENFIERYFHMRTTDAWAQALIQMKLVPANVLARKPIRNIKDYEYQPESFVHLARSGGVVTYAFGGLALQEKNPPGFWIEQDQFVLRKFRLPSEVEVTADKYSSYARNLMFPRTRVVRWGPNQVTIQTLSVAARGKDSWASFGSKVPTKMDALNTQPGGSIVDEFYKRFR